MHNSERFKSMFLNMTSSRKTLLGVGPMTVRVVEETISLANETKLPIALIPSRRQIECEELGGGYVNNWNTQSFTQFVRALDKGNFVFLSRDHSGPWQLSQTDKEGIKLSHSEAMDEVKYSLEIDIRCGFDILHIDPSPGLENARSEIEVIEDIVEIVDFCCEIQKGKTPIFEVGADEQSMVPDLPSKAEEKLDHIIESLVRRGLPKPLFYVLQTGTKVKELRNIGSFATHIPVRDMLSPTFQIPEILKLCESFGVYLKEHNADYLPSESLRWHNIFGIHAANVAPEFGVEETRAIIHLAQENNESWFVESFSDYVLHRDKWHKWLMENSQATDLEKVLMAGHYHYADMEVKEYLNKLESRLAFKGVNMDNFVRHRVRNSIKKYLVEFGYYG